MAVGSHIKGGMANQLVDDLNSEFEQLSLGGSIGSHVAAHSLLHLSLPERP